MDKVTVFHSCYFSPNEDLGKFNGFLEKLAKIVSDQESKRLFIIGDFNVVSTAWGSRYTLERALFL